MSNQPSHFAVDLYHCDFLLQSGLNSWVSVGVIATLSLAAVFYTIFKIADQTYRVPLLSIALIYSSTQLFIPLLGAYSSEHPLLDVVLINQSVGFSAFIAGLSSMFKDQFTVPREPVSTTSTSVATTVISFGMLVLYGLLLSAKGLSVINPFNGQRGYHGNDILTAGANSWATLMLVPLLIMPHLKVRWSMQAMLFAAYCYYHLLTGSRYRIILLLIGITLLYLWPQFKQLKATKKARWIASAVIVCYALMLWSANRWAIANKRYEYLTANPVANGASLFAEFNQPQVAAQVLAFSQQNGLGPDYGATMFGHLFYKSLPKQMLDLFGLVGQDALGATAKIYPPMLQRLNLANGGYYYRGMPAYGGLHEVFLSFGWWSVGVLFILGILAARLLKLFASLLIMKRLPAPVLPTLLVIWSFQWLTRGYFPQQLELAWLLILPLLAAELAIRFLKPVRQ